MLLLDEPSGCGGKTDLTHCSWAGFFRMNTSNSGAELPGTPAGTWSRSGCRTPPGPR